MKTFCTQTLAILACGMIFGLLATRSQADPLLGRDLLKFDQQPMVNTAVAGAIYFGHDELSTAYGVGNTANPPLNYQGRFMADDFADKLTSPVVHVTWWGSYIDDNFAAAPQPHVQKFLIAFESDVPQGPGQTFSQPGNVLQYDVVTLGAPAPQSGTFTETLVPRLPGDPLGEKLYKYNAELNLGHAFFEQKDTVYWLKIAALVDVPQPVLAPIPPGTTQWGWHNRDYTLQDPLASPVPSPGEFIDGNIFGQNIYHFQDDSVQGDLRFTPGAPPSQVIIQTNMLPQKYVSVNSVGVGLLDGPPGIELHSKDLAFRLYTTNPPIVPEPSTLMLLGVGVAGVFARRRSRVA